MCSCNVVVVYTERAAEPKLVAKLIDFGSAFIVPETQGPTDLIDWETFPRGTKGWRAPEIETKPPLKSQDIFKGDIWSFGLLLWRVVVGNCELPQRGFFDAPPGELAATEILSSDDHRLERLNICKVLDLALKTEPPARAGNIGDLLAILWYS
jgi:serine/threonine protein kinase